MSNNASDQVHAMLNELGNNFTNQKAGEMVVAFGCGISFLIAMIQDKQLVENATEAVCNAIRSQIKSYIDERNGGNDEDGVVEVEGEEISAEEFLREHFNPENFNG